MSLRVTRRTVARFFAAIAVTTITTAGAAIVVPAVAIADSTASMESQFIAKMNSARESAGLRPYAVASDLTSVARAHSREMAQRQELYHNPNLTTDVHNWQAVGENVGEGPTVSDIHDAFMHSPEHRANILDHDFTQVGVGVTVDSSGTIWVTEDFREPMQSSSSSSGSSSTSSTHHASTHTATHSATTTRPATTVSTAHPAVRPAAHTATHAPRPTVATTPRARLLAKLTALRTASAHMQSADPVAAAFDYVDNVTSLTTAA